MNTMHQGDLAQLLATCTFSYSPYQLLPFTGSRTTNTLRCEDSTETGGGRGARHWHPALRKEIKDRLLLQVLFFCSPSTLDMVKALHSNFRVFLLWASFAPPLLYSIPFPPPLWFWVKGKQFLFLLFSHPAFLQHSIFTFLILDDALTYWSSSCSLLLVLNRKHQGLHFQAQCSKNQFLLLIFQFYASGSMLQI